MMASFLFIKGSLFLTILQSRDYRYAMEPGHGWFILNEFLKKDSAKRSLYLDTCYLKFRFSAGYFGPAGRDRY